MPGAATDRTPVIDDMLASIRRRFAEVMNRRVRGVLAVNPNTNTCMRPSLTHLAPSRRNVEAPVPIP